ncbi:MAG: type II secretion system F family protein [Candidatus Cohnella colombiensis]|uniref:Type II secretion system F family protein n=1 Tax=Candidatus Cohnella colombiensis TaxID=3121368 RepID=A0AA95EYF6_9BACL|nr:MAG: type II secretion system F family protein [Cohnella sp.]
MTDYRRYQLSLLERLWALSIGCLFCAVLTWLMYRQVLVAMCVAPAGLLYPKQHAKLLCKKRLDKLRLQFKEALHALSALLAAGRSVDNAFLTLEDDLVMLIGQMNSDMMKELQIIANRLRLGDPLEVSLLDFAQRSGLEEVRNFSEVIAICKRAGGDLVEVVRNTSQFISEKLDVELEVSVMIANKKFESRIMMAMPFAFVGILGFMAADYMQPLYTGIGVVLLTLCIFCLLGCCWWMLRIMDIRL